MRSAPSTRPQTPTRTTRSSAPRPITIIASSPTPPTPIIAPMTAHRGRASPTPPRSRAPSGSTI
ncbi:hypothetical protein DN745_16840 [Bradymonas sediminis]|uniref:Uncharacterized protein n=1 Tax=Bradymonas sediminis TaxID=1548548 RepID=A0A2Z4FRW4_9DELT|nr:hypothetical protein DN745_16840 [Bradymonas sediminis]